MRVAIICLLVLGVAFAAPKAKTESRLAVELKKNRVANILVSFTDGTSKALQSISSRSFVNRSQRLNGVTDLLRQNAKTSQAGVLSFLASQNQLETIKSFWITNQIYIKNTNAELVTALESFPEISEILLERVIPLEKLEPRFAPDDSQRNLTWGVTKIQAADVWNHEGGNQGAAVRVGGINTGVRHTHNALRHNFVGEYGWFDPSGHSGTPHDNLGQGTHTMGTTAGSNGIGVAPAAQWMACLGCASFGCSESDLLACGEFMQCPTLADGSNPDCSRAAHVVSNAWRGVGGNSFYYQVIQSWEAAGIVSVFGIGNAGSSCGTIGSPGDHPLAIGVGNTNVDDALASSSSRGPAVSGIIKPDTTAPGTDILSAWIDGDNSFVSLTGTSTGAHVAGVAALLLSENSNLTPEQVRFYLTFGNEQEGLIKPGQDCDGVSEDTFPNNAFGHGRINSINSFNKLIADSKR